MIPSSILHVEGPDDVSVINALLMRHGVDTAAGRRYLRIERARGIDRLLDLIPEAVADATGGPVGFVLDIDVELVRRWTAVRDKLVSANVEVPDACPPDGFIGRVPDYPHPCGVWLMPDCRTDFQKLEDLCQTLVPIGNPLWNHAEESTSKAAALVDAEPDKWTRFRDVDRIKAHLHTWLAWQPQPGAALGAAINAHLLGHDSPQALAFLRWLKLLYTPHLDSLRTP